MFPELARFKFPERPPVTEPETVEHLQRVLLGVAESMIGPRDPALTIRPPQFFNRIYGRAVRTGDTARAELSVFAAQDWGLAVRELAHELVHVVDGAGRGLNVLEEGVATVFGLVAEYTATGEATEPGDGPYRDAFDDVLSMSSMPFAVVKALRADNGPMRTTRAAALMQAAPNLSVGLAAKLCSRFAYPEFVAIPDWHGQH